MPTPIIPMLDVADLQASARFYKALGFTIANTNRDLDECATEINWMMLAHQGSQLMLNAGGTVDPERGGITLSITVDDVDAAFAGLPSGAVVVFEPRDQFYGRRDFEIRDPSGYRLLIGQNRG